jgi:uncharacterized protein
MSEPQLKKKDIMQACEGMLRKELYCIFTTPANGMGPVMEQLDAHLKYQISLEERGIMFGAGPFFADNEDDWEGEGMVVVRAGSLDEARRIADDDPMHASGARSFTVRPWLLNEGTFTMKVRFSDGSREII